MPSTTSERVVRRFRSYILKPDPDVATIHVDGETLGADDLRRLLEPYLGELHEVRFRGHAGNASWAARDKNGAALSGTIRARTDVSRARVTVRLEVGVMKPEEDGDPGALNRQDL